MGLAISRRPWFYRDKLYSYTTRNNYILSQQFIVIAPIHTICTRYKSSTGLTSGDGSAAVNARITPSIGLFLGTIKGEYGGAYTGLPNWPLLSKYSEWLKRIVGSSGIAYQNMITPQRLVLQIFANIHPQFVHLARRFPDLMLLP